MKYTRFHCQSQQLVRRNIGSNSAEQQQMSEIIMNGQERQILHRIALLLDKPISPFSTKQLRSLMQNIAAPLQRIILLLLSKHRGDLLINLLEVASVNTNTCLLIMRTIQDNILLFKNTEEIWKVIINKDCLSSNDKLVFGFSNIVREAFKVTNLEKKSKLFTLAQCNIDQLWAQGEKKSVAIAMKVYALAFQKYSVQIPAFVSLMCKFLDINDNGMTNEALGFLSQEVRRNIVIQLVRLLNIKAKQQNFLFQNECLKTLTKAFRFQSQKSQLQDGLDLRLTKLILRTVQNYLQQKPTREEARKANKVYSRIADMLQSQEKAKMVRTEDFPTENEAILIQNVIGKASEYRKKYQVDKLPTMTNILARKCSFLKKGLGPGGGKAHLEQPIVIKNRRAKDYEGIIEQCLSGIENKSQHHMQATVLQNQRSLAIEDQTEVAESLHLSQQIDGDSEIDEINRLIDLAYQYKFAADYDQG